MSNWEDEEAPNHTLEVRLAQGERFNSTGLNLADHVRRRALGGEQHPSNLRTRWATLSTGLWNQKCLIRAACNLHELLHRNLPLYDES